MSRPCRWNCMNEAAMQYEQADRGRGRAGLGSREPARTHQHHEPRNREIPGAFWRSETWDPVRSDRGGLGVRAGAGVAVAALVLPARTAGAWVVAADLGVVVADAWAAAGLHVRSAVHGRSGVLQPLRATRGERGRDRRVLTLAAGSVLAT